MTPKERARKLIQDIITKNADPDIWKASRLWTTAPIAAILAEQLAIIPRTHLPQVKYIEADHSYEHTMGSCHETFGWAAAMDVAAEWVAIAEHMAERESVDQLERDAMELYTARRLADRMLPPDGWPSETVRSAWHTAARAVRAVDELGTFAGDTDLQGMDS